MYEFLYTEIDGGQVRIHFSTYRRAITEAIRDARETIRITTYVTAFSSKKTRNPVWDIIKLLEEKAQKGIPVYWILDGPKKQAANYQPARKFVNFLRGSGFKYAINFGKPTMHAKMIILDSDHAFIGSHNLTRYSISNPLDSTVELKYHSIIEELAERFDKLFGSLNHGQSY